MKFDLDLNLTYIVFGRRDPLNMVNHVYKCEYTSCSGRYHKILHCLRIEVNGSLYAILTLLFPFLPFGIAYDGV